MIDDTKIIRGKNYVTRKCVCIWHLLNRAVFNSFKSTNYNSFWVRFISTAHVAWSTRIYVTAVCVLCTAAVEVKEEQDEAINHITSSSSSVSPSTPYLTTTPIHSTCAPGAAEADEGKTVSNSYYINWLYCPPVRSKQLKNKNKKWTIKKMCSNLAGPTGRWGPTGINTM